MLKSSFFPGALRPETVTSLVDQKEEEEKESPSGQNRRFSAVICEQYFDCVQSNGRKNGEI